MELVIPEGAQVHITLGYPSRLALPPAQMSQPFPEANPPPRRGLLFKGAACGAVLLAMSATYLIGRRSGLMDDQMALARSPTAARAVYHGPIPVEHAFPDRVPLLAEPAASTEAQPSGGQLGDREPSAQLPHALAQALRQPPAIIPPPGGAARPGSVANPFGLSE